MRETRRWIGLAAGVMAVAAGALMAQATPPAPVAAPAPSAADIQRMKDMLADWPNLKAYQQTNATVAAAAPGEHRVVFMGDSITWAWSVVDKFFPGKPYLNRGISGQTTPQMLIRFQPDVVHLHPSVVVLLAGTNDVAGNTGPSTPEMIEDNIASMAAIAKQNDIKMVIASILPAYRYPWKPEVQPVEEIRSVNAWIKDYCSTHGLVYLDYYSAMVDERGGTRAELTKDGVHPNAKGYEVMAPLAETAISQALTQP